MVEKFYILEISGEILHSQFEEQQCTFEGHTFLKIKSNDGQILNYRLTVQWEENSLGDDLFNWRFSKLEVLPKSVSKTINGDFLVAKTYHQYIVSQNQKAYSTVNFKSAEGNFLTFSFMPPNYIVVTRLNRIEPSGFEGEIVEDISSQIFVEN